MVFPERFSNLPVATWPRLRALLDVPTKAAETINMTIGEPRHAFPAFVGDVLAANLQTFGKYPANNGSDALLAAIGVYLKRRYDLDVDAGQILALNGTREGLFNAAIALGPAMKNGKRPVVLSPNPFYPAYSAAAAAIGAEAIFVPATDETGHLPDFTAMPEDVLERTTLAYICSPANPQGAIADEVYWTKLISLAEKYDFKIFADECYSEIYRDKAPTGALEMAQRIGCDPDRVMSAYLSQDTNGSNPGDKFIRVAMVAPTQELQRGLTLIRDCLYG